MIIIGIMQMSRAVLALCNNDYGQ